MARFDEAFTALKGLTNYETMARPPYGGRAMNLPRTRALLRKLGNPERHFPSLRAKGCVRLAAPELSGEQQEHGEDLKTPDDHQERQQPLARCRNLQVIGRRPHVTDTRAHIPQRRRHR